MKRNERFGAHKDKILDILNDALDVAHDMDALVIQKGKFDYWEYDTLSDAIHMIERAKAAVQRIRFDAEKDK